ncbi:MAG: DUF4910 domain-containing protein [Candidatus Bathyarchaeota archaeon]|nr:DUF4910 domain-containing protein [Candidatus Bathyarchaeota archaeon]
MFQRIASVIGKEFSGLLAKEYATRIYWTDHYFSYDKFHQTAKYCADEMEKIGLEDVEIIPYKADGKTAYGDWIIPRAWDAEDATLEIIEPHQRTTVLASYREEPTCLFFLSAPTPPEGVEAEVVRVEDCTNPTDYAGKDLRGKVIFTSTRPHRTKHYLLDAGAIGLIYNADRDGELVRWDNYTLAPRNDEGLFGFSISQRHGEELKKIIQEAEKRGGKVRVRSKIKARLYDGTVDVVTGVLPGERRDEEVLALAHLYEVGANDNASGAGLILETLNAMNKLIVKGELSKPKRSIRALFGFECCGFMAYVVSHPDVIRRQVAAINPDMVGENQEMCGSHLRVHVTPGSNPSYIDALVKMIICEVIAKDDPSFRWRVYPPVVCDSFIADPMIGVPSVSLMQMPDRFYHSSLDAPDKIDPESMMQIGVCVGTYLYFIAQAGVKEAIWLAHLVKDQALEESIRQKTRFISQVSTLSDSKPIEQAIKEFVERLDCITYRGRESLGKILRITAEDSEVMGFLNSMEQKIAKDRNQLAKDARKFIEQIGLTWKLPKRRLTELEEKASTMIPQRLIPGPLTVETMPDEAKRKERWKPGWEAYFNVNLYWADGKRSLLEIYRSSTMETGPAKLEDLIDYVEFLERYGYIKLKTRIPLKRR